jgi:hypothetical protein
MKKTKKPLPPVARVIRAYCAGRITIRGVGLALNVSIAEAKTLLDLYDVEIHGGRKRKKAEDDDRI